MQEGGGFAFHLMPMVHDPNYRPKPITVNCLGKFTFTINEYFVAHDGFLAMIYLLLIVVTHTIMAYYKASRSCYKIVDCKEEFHHN
jgi:hypothetical protein